MTSNNKFNIKVKPNSRHESVELLDDNTYLVKVNCPPVEGRANKRVIELLAKHFKVSKSQINISLGTKSKNKVVTINS